MAVADRRCGRHEHVQCQLKKSYNRVPPQLRRHVRAARWQHPLRFAIEAAIVEKGHGIARILEIDDRIGPHAAFGAESGPAASPSWFMNRTNDPSRNWGSQAGEPGLRRSVRKRQSLLE